MNIRPLSIIMPSMLFFVVLCLYSNSYAHRVNVFAYVEGDKVFTESYFSKKKRVHQGKVEIFNTSDGAKVLAGITDDEGIFNFPIPAETKAAKSGLLIVLHASEGHRGEWTIAADEIFPEKAGETPPPTVSEKSELPAAQPLKTSSADIARLDSQLKEINAKIDTVKRLLINEQEKGPGVNEIFSGIGYILGLFGVAAFFMSRKK